MTGNVIAVGALNSTRANRKVDRDPEVRKQPERGWQLRTGAQTRVTLWQDRQVLPGSAPSSSPAIKLSLCHRASGRPCSWVWPRDQSQGINRSATSGSSCKRRGLTSFPPTFPTAGWNAGAMAGTPVTTLNHESNKGDGRMAGTRGQLPHSPEVLCCHTIVGFLALTPKHNLHIRLNKEQNRVQKK